MIIRTATLNDLPTIVKIHVAAFPGFFMTLLGPQFLTAYYRLAIEYPKSLCLVLEEATIQGFVVGFKTPSLFYQRLSTRKISFGFAALSYLVWRPSLWSQILSNSRRVSHAASQQGVDEKVLELASIGVNPEAGRRGFGKELVHHFLEHAAQYQVDKVVLTTDARENDAVNIFYQQLGFRIARVFETSGQRLMNEYVFDFDTSVSSKK